MKKVLLLFVAAMLSFGILMAGTPLKIDKVQSLKLGSQAPQTLRKAPITRADEGGFTLQFCQEIYSWYTLQQQNKLTYRCYLYIPADIATQIAGNKVTDITFSAASNFSSTREGEVFVTESLDGDYTTHTACTIENCLAAAQAGKAPYQTVALQEPYTIKEGTGFFMGYVVEACRYSPSQGSDYPVGVDGYQPNGYSGYVDIFDANGNQLGTVDLSTDLGASSTNLFLAAKTVGKANGIENVFMLGNMVLGDVTMPVLNAQKATSVYLPVRNVGSNKLTTIEYSLELNGTAGQRTTQDISVAPMTEDYILLPAPAYKNGKNNLRLTVHKVNGVELGLTSSASCIAIDGEGYDRKFVVEEGTGTWCGYCPRGIVGMDKMSERYPDKFIGIAVHNGDAMAVTSYNGLMNFFSGFPSCIINRDPVFVIDPNADYLEQCMQIWKEERAPAQVQLAVGTPREDNSIDVKATTTFAYDETEADYRLAFVILENGLTAKQTNYFAGYPDELEWWGSQGGSVNWTFSHTARDIFSYAGLAGSIPTTIKAETPMTFGKTLSTSHVTDWSQTAIVALLIDVRSGTILNATRVEAKDYGTNPDAIHDLATPSVPVRYYNLQGQPVSTPQRGTIVIRQRGEQVEKVMMK